MVSIEPAVVPAVPASVLVVEDEMLLRMRAVDMVEDAGFTAIEAVNADDARVAGFVNTVVAPGHTEAEARKVAREICALPAEAVAISRKLLKLPPEDLTRRIDQESHLFGERMRSKEAVAAFKAFFARKKA